MRCLAPTMHFGEALCAIALDIRFSAVPRIIMVVFHVRPKTICALPCTVEVVVVPTVQSRAVLPRWGLVAAPASRAVRCRVPLVVGVVFVATVLCRCRAWGRSGLCIARRRARCRSTMRIIEVGVQCFQLCDAEVAQGLNSGIAILGHDDLQCCGNSPSHC